MDYWLADKKVLVDAVAAIVKTAKSAQK